MSKEKVIDKYLQELVIPLILLGRFLYKRHFMKKYLSYGSKCKETFKKDKSKYIVCLNNARKKVIKQMIMDYKKEYKYCESEKCEQKIIKKISKLNKEMKVRMTKRIKK